MTLADRRILFVHAHPDDETINNAATMARYVAEGAQVTLVTCTAGEEGEVLVPELEHLAADRDDALGPHRVGELTDAMAAIGVTDFRFLGGAGHFRDSGMKWAEDGTATQADETRDDTFWHADLTVASDLLVQIIRETRPQVLVAYDEFGGYGHPDHVQVHRVTARAVELAARRPRYLEVTMNRDAMRRLFSAAVEAGQLPAEHAWDVDGPLDDGNPLGTPEADIHWAVDVMPWLDHKRRALAAHASQPDAAGMLQMPEQAFAAMMGTEHFREEGRPVGMVVGWPFA